MGEEKKKKKKKFKKTSNDVKTGPRHSTSHYVKNGNKLLAHADFFEFAPMPCVCCNFLNNELVQERAYIRIWDNRMEINRPFSPLCCLTMWDSCVTDCISVNYFDKAPVRQTSMCCTLFGPPVLFLYRPKCLCFDFVPCFGESIMSAPTDCCQMKQCILFGSPCYSNRMCCPCTATIATGIYNGNAFMHDWRMAAQNYRRLHGLDEGEVAMFKVVDGFLGSTTDAGSGKNAVDQDAQEALKGEKEKKKEEEKRTGKKTKAKHFCFCLPPLPRISRKTVEERMYDVYMDYEGKLVRAIDMLQVDDDERDLWVRMWMEIDEDRNNEMSYGEFTDYFQIAQDEWSRRTFMMINQAGNGVATLAEFITFCTTYIIVDRKATEEFTFRLMSRRNSTQFNPTWSCLGMEDVRGFVGERYNPKSVAHRNKLAFSIFKMMDRDGDGGLDMEEWHEFCEGNDAFCRFGHTILHHLRKCIFGSQFWVERTRLLKTSQGEKGGGKVNRESELYCTGLQGDEEEPMVDSKFKVRNNKLTERDMPVEEYLKAIRPTSTFLGGLDMAELPQRPFEVDMAEIHELLTLEKAEKKANRDALMASAADLGTRGHDLMRNAILDLTEQRRPKRWVWNIWCKAVDMVPKPKQEEVPETHTDAEARANGEAAYAAHMSDVHVKIIGVTETRKAEANEAAFQSYLTEYTVGIIPFSTAATTGDRTAVTRALHGADGPVLMTDIYRKTGAMSASHTRGV